MALWLNGREQHDREDYIVDDCEIDNEDDLPARRADYINPPHTRGWDDRK